MLPYRSRLADRLARPVAPFGWTVRPLRSALTWEIGPSWVFWLRDALSAVRSLRYITRDRSWRALYAGSVEIEAETVTYATQSFETRNVTLRKWSEIRDQMPAASREAARQRTAQTVADERRRHPAEGCRR